MIRQPGAYLHLRQALAMFPCLQKTPFSEPVFFAAGLFAAAFLATVFLATVFLAAVFLLAVFFFAVCFLAAAMVFLALCLGYTRSIADPAGSVERAPLTRALRRA